MLKHIPWLPWSAAPREKPIIDAEVARDAPREDETDSESEKYWVDAYRTREKIVEIHEKSEERRNAGKGADDKGDTDEKFSVRDDIRPNDGMREDC